MLMDVDSEDTTCYQVRIVYLHFSPVADEFPHICSTPKHPLQKISILETYAKIYAHPPFHPVTPGLSRLHKVFRIAPRVSSVWLKRTNGSYFAKRTNHGEAHQRIRTSESRIDQCTPRCINVLRSRPSSLVESGPELVDLDTFMNRWSNIDDLTSSC
ncbi:hypothetical protein BT96DRAFT_318360 [Gymnopus androsaceus JB14]|uniref:Uncharacterized protein n=1 Tax=Gymnopus androsaceus JB14 TaxID=1447944 RepID=A0A6A4H1C9_9AGAR|nr:hypothetical protein BT96DRAFT_318360 [Gymnopus androsaceus JB14]